MRARLRLSALSPKRHSILSKSLAPRILFPSDRIDLEYFNFSSFFIIPILILDSFVTSIFHARILQEDEILSVEAKLLSKIFRRRTKFQVPLNDDKKMITRGGNKDKVRSILLSDSELSLAKILNYHRWRGISDDWMTRRDGGSEKTCTAENSKARITLIMRIKRTWW